MPKCDFNKVAINLFLKTSLDGCYNFTKKRASGFIIFSSLKLYRIFRNFFETLLNDYI